MENRKISATIEAPTQKSNGDYEKQTMNSKKELLKLSGNLRV
jgi:hypothetical protein